MQKIFLRGRLGKDSEITPIGERQTLKFPLACDYGKGEKTNTTWYDVFFYKTQLQQYLTKGKDVIVIGRLDVRKSEGKDGKTYVNLTVYADDLEFIGKGGSGTQSQVYQQPNQQAVSQPKPAPQPVSQADDGLPF